MQAPTPASRAKWWMPPVQLIISDVPSLRAWPQTARWLWPDGMQLAAAPGTQACRAVAPIPGALDGTHSNREDSMSGRRILVTGGTSGTSAGIARAFAALGGRLVATGATDAEVSSAREAMKAFPAIDVLRLDVRNG